jgi:coniferyl-aldehyde dehydrogenase
LNLNDPIAPPALLQAAFDRQKAAFARDGGLTAEARRAALDGLAQLLRTEGEALAEAIDRDFQGRSRAETRLLELFPAIESVRHARRHLASWMKPRNVATSLWFQPGRSRIVPQALGVVGIVVPWNYPIYLAVGPAVAALAAGNRVLVKMSETAPHTAELFARLVAERFDPSLLHVITGDAEVGRAFSALPFDHLLFTGSTAVGRHVMRAAAENLTPVTLELGGKSPAIVGRGFDVRVAAQRILYGKCLNAGQTCIAPDYVLVPEERLEDFARAAKDAVAAMYPKLLGNPDYTSIVDERHRARLRGWLEEARGRGARIVPLAGDGEDLSHGPRIAPTLVVGAPDDTRLMQEEIFGPILPLVPYRGLDEAIAHVNARPRPLALYVFEHDRDAIDAVLSRTVSGGVSVNETLVHIAQEELPFGGVGPSGMGQYHGRAGFETFSKHKPVFHQSRFNGLPLFRPPYGARFEALVKLLLR